MDLPKCKICGERHRLGTCSPMDETIHVVRIEPIGSTKVTEAKFDRVAYQREYMVGWRVRQKAKKEK